MNIYSNILIITALINAFLAIYALVYRKTAITFSYSAFMLTLAIYAFGYAFELNTDKLEHILFWLNVQYLGIPFFPSTLIVFSVYFAGKSHWLKPTHYFILFGISIITFTLHLTNWGQLFYKNYNIVHSGPFHLSLFEKGAWYWVHQAFSNLAILFSIIVFSHMLITDKSSQNKIKATILLISATLPWFFYLNYLLGKSPYNIDLTPFSFAIIGVLGAIGLFRYQLLDFVPLALENVFESMRDGVIIIDNHNYIKSINPAAKNILKELEGDPIDLSYIKIFANYPDLINLIKPNSNLCYSELEITRGNKKRFYIANSSIIFDEHKIQLGKSIILSDITELKKTEQHLKENEQRLKELNATKDKFVAIIAHDLRNPFHAILNLSDMLVDKLNNNQLDKAKLFAQAINESTTLTYQLLQNLLEWSRIQRGAIEFSPQNFNINSVVNFEIRMLNYTAQQKQVVLVNEVPESFDISADFYMLKTIIRNLISNAIKYSHNDSQILISAYKTDTHVIVFVKDNGIGMTEKEKEKLFRIDSSSSRKGTNNELGTGLGLLLCKEFVNYHNGSIWVESEEDKGSIFYFSLSMDL